MENKNKAVLEDFVRYCAKNPELRFWQALRNWSGYNYVLVANYEIACLDDIWRHARDTFSWKGRND